MHCFPSLTQARISKILHNKRKKLNMMKVAIVAILALATSLVSAYDPSPLQDFCVAINNTDSAGMYMHALSLLVAVHSSIIIIYILLNSRSL